MADNLTTAEETRLLDLSLPTDGSMYLALFSVAPGEAGGGTELTGSGYARQVCDFNAAASGSKTNNGEILFPEVTGSDWATIVALAIMDAVSAGNMRWYRVLSGPEQRTPAVGDQYRVGDAALTFTLA